NKAIDFYNQALAIKGAETYPKQRVEESKKLLAEQKAAELAAAELAAKDKDYNDDITKADKAFSQGAYRDAKALYQNALALKDDQYPRKRIAEVDAKLEALALAEREKENAAKLEADFRAKIDKGNAALGAESYQAAREHFNGALALKP